MSIDTLAQNSQFRDFFETIDAWQSAYRHRLLTLVAVVHEGSDVILRANLHLSPQPRAPLKQPFRTPSLRASQHYLAGDAGSIEGQLLAGLAQGFALPDGLARFVSDANSGISPWTQARNAWTRLPDPYVAQLTLTGINTNMLLRGTRTQLERELLKADGLFKTLEEWAADHGLKLSTSDSTVIEVFAERVAWLDKNSSISGNSVELVVRLARELDPAELRLKASNADSNGTRIQEITSGSSIEWSKAVDGGLEAIWRFKLPHDAVIHCTAIYGGCVQHDLELADPWTLPNRARLMIEVADPGLEHLRRLLTTPNAKKESRAFEATVHLLLQMLGFRSSYTGALKHMEDEADVLALSPAGDALIVECTTAPPDVQKFDKLLTRAAAMRKALCTSSNRFPPDRVIPVMVVPNTWDEIGPAAKEHVKAHQVVLLCREDIEELIHRTRFAPDADSVLKDWLGKPLQRFLSGQY